MDTVIVAFDNEAQGKKLGELVEMSGLAKCLFCRSGDQIRRALTGKQIHCVIASYRLADGLSEWVYADIPPTCSMVMIGVQHQLDMCESDEIVKLPTPISRPEVLLVVRTMLQFGNKMERVLRNKRSAVDDTNINRAKELLMQHKRITEDEAHRFLQRKSMTEGRRIEHTARAIIRELE